MQKEIIAWREAKLLLYCAAGDQENLTLSIETNFKYIEQKKSRKWNLKIIKPMNRLKIKLGKLFMIFVHFYEILMELK